MRDLLEKTYQQLLESQKVRKQQDEEKKKRQWEENSEATRKAFYALFHEEAERVDDEFLVTHEGITLRYDPEHFDDSRDQYIKSHWHVLQKCPVCSQWKQSYECNSVEYIAAYVHDFEGFYHRCELPEEEVELIQDEKPEEPKKLTTAQEIVSALLRIAEAIEKKS